MTTTGAAGGTATTQVVTILVTDQVGSTELRARLGDDAADRALRAHTLLLREAVAAAGGQEVKHLGDGLLASFASPSAAVACAVAIQQAVHRQNQRPDAVPTAVRIGLDVGESSTEEGDWFGTTVVVATRLCHRAGGGQVLASDLVRRLVGSRGSHDFGPAEACDLKGIPEPVLACPVRWSALPATTVALPEALAAPGSTTFIGRAAELDRLSALWEQARAGRPRLAVLVGDPGIGKTRLAIELARTVAAAGATVLLGRSDEDSLSPYQPLAEPIRHYVLSRPPERLAAEVGESAAELASVVPEVLRRVPGGPTPPPPVDRYRVFEAVAGLVRAAAAGAPVLVVLDDLQWAEKPALMLLKHLVRHLGDAPVLVLATCRAADLAAAADLADVLASLRRERLVETVPVAGLAEREVAALVQELGGSRTPASFVRAIFSTTEGNPLFVESLVRHLGDTGLAAAAGAGDGPVGLEGLGLPEDVTGLIGRRLSRLSERSQKALAVAAAVGREFPAGLLAEVAELGEDDLVQVLEEAVDAQVVQEVPGPGNRYAFHHAITRQVLYEGLLGLRRAGLHRRIGGALEARPGPRTPAQLAQLAHHFLAAAPGAPGDEGERAVSYAYEAATAAMGAVAYEDAGALCERALQVLERASRPDPARRLQALLLLGRAHCRAGDTDQARKAFGSASEAAQAMGTPRALCEAALAYGEIPAESGVVDQRLVALLEAATAAVGGDDARRACLLARLAEELYFTRERQRCLDLSAEALAIARRTGDPGALVEALGVRRLLLVGPDGPQARLAASDELVAVAEAAGDRLVALRSRAGRVVDLVDAGRLDGIDEEIEAVAALAADARQPAWAWFPAKWRAMRALMAGRIDEGERLAQQALALGQRPHGNTAVQAYIVQLVEVRRCQGRLAELEANMATGIKEYRAVPAWRCGLAWLHAALGRDGDARRELDELAAGRFAALPDDFTWLTCAAMLSEVAVHLGDAARAATLAELLAPYGEHCMFAGQAELFGGTVARYRGQLATVLGRWPEAEELLAAGRARAERLGARPEVARTELARARLYDARGGPGDRSRAATAAERCAAEAHELGLHALARTALTR